jgi:phage FluMu protein Com
MAFKAYRCKKCHKTVLYAFENEFDPNSKCPTCKEIVEWRMMPHDPYVIHQTDIYLNEAMIDCIDTGVELDRILRREAEEERELQLVQDAIKKI